MAISNKKDSTTLQIKYANGENKDGTPKMQSQKFSMVSSSATDEALYNIGAALANLITNQSFTVKKIEDSSLLSE